MHRLGTGSGILSPSDSERTVLGLGLLLRDESAADGHDGGDDALGGLVLGGFEIAGGALGVMVCGSISANDLPIKGWIAGVFGILLATVGIDVINQYPRFVYACSASRR
jgi:hypothetical protein